MLGVGNIIDSHVKHFLKIMKGFLTAVIEPQCIGIVKYNKSIFMGLPVCFFGIFQRTFLIPDFRELFGKLEFYEIFAGEPL